MTIHPLYAASVIGFSKLLIVICGNVEPDGRPDERSQANETSDVVEENEQVIVFVQPVHVHVGLGASKALKLVY